MFLGGYSVKCSGKSGVRLSSCIGTSLLEFDLSSSVISVVSRRRLFEMKQALTVLPAVTSADLVEMFLDRPGRIYWDESGRG